MQIEVAMMGGHRVGALLGFLICACTRLGSGPASGSSRQMAETETSVLFDVGRTAVL